MSMVWATGHPREPFALSPDQVPPDRVYYRAADGWEAPLWRYPPLPGASGEPVLLLHDLAANVVTFDLVLGLSLARALQGAGFDVYLMEHRGDRHAVPPDDPAGAGFDFDDIVVGDVPAAIERVRSLTGAERVLWVGHSLGGQLLYAHLALGGAAEVAAGAALCAAVQFEPPKSHARLAAMVARLLPSEWIVPTRALSQVLAPFGGSELSNRLSPDTDGPVRRGLQLHGMEDTPVGLLRQMSRWLSSGSLCDRHDRLDYLAALEGSPVPLFVLAAEGDTVCPPSAAEPAVAQFQADRRVWRVLGPEWGHQDPLVGRQAAAVVFPELIAFLDAHRGRCWSTAR
jgi:predicted alpha/beta hydrolase